MKHAAWLGFTICVYHVMAFADSRPASLCDTWDDRTDSKVAPIARLVHMNPARPDSFQHVCTGFLISRSCMITAGHCGNALTEIQFNPKFKVNEEDSYRVDSITVVYGRSSPRSSSDEPADDWMIFRLHPNFYTKKLPGEIYGWLPLATQEPSLGDDVTVIGFGDEGGVYSQTSGHGPINMLKATAYGYRVDTQGGNSGSPILDTRTNKVFGIHTNSGCDAQSGSYNYGTPIVGNPKLQKAIDDCLKADK